MGILRDMEVTLLRTRPRGEASRTHSHRNSRGSRRPTGSPAWSCSQDSVSSSHPPLVGAGTAPVAADDVFIDQLADGVAGHGSAGGADEDAERSSDNRSHAGAEQRADGGTGLTAGGCGDIASGSGAEQGRGSANRSNRIGFLPANWKGVKTSLNVLGAALGIVSAVYFAKPFAVKGLSPTVEKEKNE